MKNIKESYFLRSLQMAKKYILILTIIILLSGCNIYQVGNRLDYSGDDITYFSLNDALKKGPSNDMNYLKRLREQATNKNDKAILDQKINKIKERQQAIEEANAKRYKQEREEQEKKVRKEKERILTELEANRKELIKQGGGTLRNKSTQEVKKLVDTWDVHIVDMYYYFNTKEDVEIIIKYFSVEKFYQIFGRPERTQLIDDYYFLYYNCKDGIVQIGITASDFDDDEVSIKELNIF